MNCRSTSKIIPVFVLLISVVYVSGEKLCEELPVIKNGKLLLIDKNATFSVNESISYACDEDFRTDEVEPKVTCILKDNIAVWTEDACKPIIISCPRPPDIDNANFIGNIFTYPNNITYVCNEGYRMNGLATKYCSKSGLWQPPSLPECDAIYCPDLTHPQNGEVLPTTWRPTSIAVYKCDRYYKLVGESERVCQADGTWSGNDPICEKITCKAPGKFPNGRIIGVQGSIYNASDILIFQCNDGTHRTSKCLENGEWSVRPPTCSGTTIVEPSVIPTTVSSKDGDIDESKVDSCEDPGIINHGDRSFTTLHINSTVTYTCDEGYQLKGISTLICMENGKWDLDRLPKCVKPLSVQTVIGIVFGVIILICVVVGAYFYYRYRMKSIRGYGEKSKALTADATDIEEITGLERDKKHIPVTVL